MTLLRTKTGVVDYPQKIIIYSPPKIGKTTSLSKLENNFIVDLESGSGNITGNVLNVQQEVISRKIENAGERAVAPWTVITELYNELLTLSSTPKGIPYRHITFDTIDALEEFCRIKIWAEEEIDPLLMDYGKGYGMIRDRLMKLLNLFIGLGLNVIIVGHRKKAIVEKSVVRATDKNVKAKGVITVTTNDLEITGRLKSILFAWADCIGFGNRIVTEGKSGFYLSFIRDEEGNVEAGSRIARLEGRNILIHEIENEKTVVNNWEEIFPKGE